MADFDFKKLKRLTVVYRIAQFLLLALLAATAFMFQAKYPGHFFFSLMVAVVIQGILLYPMYRLAWRDAGIEFESSSTTLTADDLVGLRKRRLWGDLWKVSLLIFFLIFVAKIPDAQKTGTPFFLSTSLYLFLLIFLTYFQCFNYSVKKRLSSV